MRHSALSVAVIAMLASGRSVFAQDAAAAIIRKAIEAQGGEKQFAKLRNMRMKIWGSMYDGKTKSFYMTEVRWRLPDHYKQINMLHTKPSIHYGLVISGDKGWSIFTQRHGYKSAELTPEQVIEHRNSQLGSDLHPLLFVNEREEDLSLLDEVMIDGKPAVGVRVKSARQSDVKLYFDKVSGLLIKREVKHDGASLDEVHYGEYWDKGGLKHYRRISRFLDGKLYLEGYVTGLEFFDKLDPKAFEQP